jgi:drug/metabolite transporter (DMT)-like permease
VLGIRLDQGLAIGKGDALTLLGSFFFACQIVLLDRLGKQVDSAHLTVPAFVVTGLLSLLLAGVGSMILGAGLEGWLSWTVGMLRQGPVLRDVLLLTVLSTVLAFHWMNVYQPRVTAGRAALIYFLEPLFGSGFSIAWGHDPLSARLAVGGLLILGGNVLVELPVWCGAGKPKSKAGEDASPPASGSSDAFP